MDAGRRKQKVRTMVILGSGGHTTEMLRLIEKLDKERYEPMYYVTAETDIISRPKAEASHGFSAPNEAWLVIPRAREVGQSWFTTVLTTVRALFVAIFLLFRIRPQLILANGPGTCLPLCVAARLFCGTRVIFCESWCRVDHLSLTGKLIYPFADRFLVHWPNLVTKQYPRAECIGRLC